MKKQDDDFVLQLCIDDSLCRVFEDLLNGKATRAENSLVQTIERALENRVSFAENQKRHFQQLFEYVEPVGNEAAVVQQDFDEAMQLLHRLGTASARKWYRQKLGFLNEPLRKGSGTCKQPATKKRRMNPERSLLLAHDMFRLRSMLGLPDEVTTLIYEYVVYIPKSHKELKQSVKSYCHDPSQFLPIGSWDVSNIPRFTELFKGQEKLN